VAHALAAHLRLGNFDTALFADDAAMLEALVLAAEALVVLDRPEDLGAEQAVSGFLTSPYDQERILSGEARPIVIASNSSSAARFCLNRSANRLFMCNFS
jgi:hypothetical protein